MNKHGFKLLFLAIATLGLFGCEKDDTPDDIVNEIPDQEGVFFSDNFETGDISRTENGFTWSDNTVEVASTPNGTSGLKFTYGPNELNEYSWKEQRFKLGNNYSDLWIKYDLFVPDNFDHRSPLKYELEQPEDGMLVGDTMYKTDENGVRIGDDWGVVYAISADSIWVDKILDYYLLNDGNYMKNERTGVVSQVKKRHGYGTNNKFLVVWQGDYGSLASGNGIDLEYWSRGRGSSNLSYYLFVDQGTKLRDNGHTISDDFIINKEEDAGKWMELIFHFKIAGSADNDGVIHIIKNGKDYLNVRNIGNFSELGYNYFEKGYLLGWSNSGYKEETTFYIDNVVFSTSPIAPGEL